MRYRLYLDEVGNEDLGHAHERRHRFLSLTGVIMELQTVSRDLQPRIAALKELVRSDPDEPVHLHRKDILQKKGPFQILGDEETRREFDQRALEMIAQVSYRLITVTIDKLWFREQSNLSSRHPYHFLLEMLIERYVLFLRRRQAQGDIMPEKRQGRHDEALQAEFERFRTQGTKFASAEEISRWLPQSRLKFRSKKECVAGLELCDLLAHPSYVYGLSLMGHETRPGPFARQVIAHLKSEKYDRDQRSGEIRGYGQKFLPDRTKAAP